MASNFTTLWNMSFAWLGSLMSMPLPIYFGGVALSLLDIVIGTVFIVASFGFIRALLKSGFSIAGKNLIEESNHQRNIEKLNSQTHTEYQNRQLGAAFLENYKKGG